MTDLELLKEYGEGQSQQAFAELVGRHLEWVYGAAVRRVRDRELAEDVAQGVFIALARRARSLGREQALSPWLLRVTRCAAISALRAASRRQRHEQKAAAMRPESILNADSDAQWEEVAPLLDDQVLHLGKKDQEAILLRFYERKSLAEVGEAMGIGEEAARKRVERAVGKLREKLSGKGVEVEAGSLGAMVLAHAAEGGGAAGLAEKVMAGIGGGAGNGTAGLIAKGAEKMMVWAKVKVAALVVGVVLAGAGAVGIGAQGVLREQNPAPIVSGTASRPAIPTDIQCVDASGKAVSGAEVYLRCGVYGSQRAAGGEEASLGPVTSDGNGIAHFEGLSAERPGDRGWRQDFYARVPGKLVGVASRSSDWLVGPQSIGLVESGTLVGKVEVPPGFEPASVTLKVESLTVRDGLRPEGAVLFRADSFGGKGESLFHYSVGVDGSFSIPDVPKDGRAYLVANGTGLGEAQWMGAWSADSVQLAMAREGVIEGVVTYEGDGKPAADVMVMAGLVPGDRTYILHSFKARTGPGWALPDRRPA